MENRCNKIVFDTKSESRVSHDNNFIIPVATQVQQYLRFQQLAFVEGT